jgi:hypothetical protein
MALLGLGENWSQKNDLAVKGLRSAMFDALDAHCPTVQIDLELRIEAAGQVTDLWHLRDDLMLAISATRGELVAQKALAELAPLFWANGSPMIEKRPRPGQDAYSRVTTVTRRLGL